MEIEAKYTLPDRAAFDRLLALRALGGYTLRPAAVEHLTDHYLETSRRAIAQGGYALRLRQSTGQTEWLATLKSLGGSAGALHQREELEVTVPAQSMPAAWPAGPARDLALRLAGGEPFAELFQLDQTRHRRDVLSAASQPPVAEMSLDFVTLSTIAGEVLTYELEFELRPSGSLDDLQALAAALAGYTLAPQPLSKFARALALLDDGLPPTPPAAPKSAGVHADDPMAEAGRKVLRFHFERMLAQEAGVRAGLESKPVHAMRVAARRQRAALRLFGDYYKPKALRRLRVGLQTVARHLGAVRDLDVQLEAARDYQAALPAENAAALQPLLAAWAAERDEARAALLAHLDSAAYQKFKKKYAEFAETEGAGVPPPAEGDTRPTLLRHVMPGRLWDHYAAVRAYETVLTGAPIETLHALRIDGKRLRYALEFAAEAVDPAVEELIEAVVALQEHLGALHDVDVCAARLVAFDAGLGKKAAEPATRRAVRAYQAHGRARLTSLRRTLGQPWRVVNSPHFRKRLGRVASRL